MIPPNNGPLLWFALASAVATLFGAGAYYTGNEFAKVVFGGFALTFGLVAVFILADWLGKALAWHQWQARQRSAITPAVVYAQALRPLNEAQLALARRYQTIEAQGMISKDGVLWSFAGLRGTNIPVDWAAWYLGLAQGSAPELYPVRGREGDEFWSWEDTELARAFVEVLIAAGLALPAAGRRAAAINLGLDELGELLGLSQ